MSAGAPTRAAAGQAAASYAAATRHPLAGVVFVIPLLLFYELGLYHLESAPRGELRNGADAWLRGVLQQVGVSPIYGAPALLLGVLLAWSVWRRDDRPRELVGLWIGMVFESAALALGLVCLSQLVLPVMQALGGILEGPARLVGLALAAAGAEAAWEQIIGYVGAGIYEEALFRLLLFSGLAGLFALVECPRRMGLAIAALVSALLFAAAHSAGVHGEPFRLVVFLFRSLAGLYFTWIYHCRGYGIAVGAHAGYDVLVGLFLRTS
jgi:membrane protease YdiL (CAAX protease family)